MTLRGDINELRSIPAIWKSRSDPLSELHEIRHGGMPSMEDRAREFAWRTEHGWFDCKRYDGHELDKMLAGHRRDVARDERERALNEVIHTCQYFDDSPMAAACVKRIRLLAKACSHVVKHRCDKCLNCFACCQCLADGERRAAAIRSLGDV